MGSHRAGLSHPHRPRHLPRGGRRGEAHPSGLGVGSGAPLPPEPTPPPHLGWGPRCGRLLRRGRRPSPPHPRGPTRRTGEQRAPTGQGPPLLRSHLPSSPPTVPAGRISLALAWASLACFVVAAVLLALPVSTPEVQDCGAPGAYLVEGRLDVIPDAEDRILRPDGEVVTLDAPTAQAGPGRTLPAAGGGPGRARGSAPPRRHRRRHRRLRRRGARGPAPFLSSWLSGADN